MRRGRHVRGRAGAEGPRALTHLSVRLYFTISAPEKPLSFGRGPFARGRAVTGTLQTGDDPNPSTSIPYSSSTLLLIVALALLPQAQADTSPTSAVHYRGEISAENNRRLFAAIGHRTVTQLIIDSEGGEVEAGIGLGDWVFKRRIDVIVEGRCLSSCANYVFPAGRKKIVLKGAVVAWHGNYHHLQATGLWRDDIAARMARTGEDAATSERHVRKQVQHLVRMERDYFRRIGIDQYLCWVGKMPPYSASNYYTMSAEDMGRYGVRNVQTPAGYDKMNFTRFAEDTVFIRTRPPPQY
jgi:hypothetical protein